MEYLNDGWQLALQISHLKPSKNESIIKTYQKHKKANHYDQVSQKKKNIYIYI